MSSVIVPSQSNTLLSLTPYLTDLAVADDSNVPDKHWVHDTANFTFIGPDSQDIPHNDVDSCITLSKAIRDTNLPSYRMARFPVQSGLNIEEWHHCLKVYQDKRLMQYLTFWLPLFINNSDSLYNRETTNHYFYYTIPGTIRTKHL